MTINLNSVIELEVEQGRLQQMLDHDIHKANELAYFINRNTRHIEFIKERIQELMR